MCGIFSLLNTDNRINNDIFHKAFNMAQHRGPEMSRTIDPCIAFKLGFHRLAINGVNSNSDQPLYHDNIVLVCNGEIYNYKQLYKLFPDDTAKTDSDCEIIIHMFKKYGIEYTLNNLDGVFAFCLIDLENNTSYLARDPYGVRPMYHLKFSYSSKLRSNIIFHGFASELKQLSVINSHLIQNIDHNKEQFPIINQFTPGTYSKFVLNQGVWEFKNNIKYSTHGFSIYNGPNIKELIRDKLINAVKKRVIGTTDRPVACLLSGGLDSSLITSIVSKFIPNVETYSIGLKGSEDLKYAKKVAEFLKTNHTEIVVDEDDFFNAIPEVIEKIESYDTTTVRASVGNYLVAKYIKAHSDSKVIFNGDGSDEVTGGYMYMHAAPNPTDFDHECRRLLNQIHLFDVARSDRSISTNGLEPRTPFLDRDWVQFFLSIPKDIRFHPGHNKCEKYLLREAFDDGTWLPTEVLFRTKEAFSDGVSSQTKSWFEIINEKVKDKWPIAEVADAAMKSYKYEHLPPQTMEQLYYRSIYDKLYPHTETNIPYFWMPKFVDATDSSARTLDVYSQVMAE